MRPRLTAWLVGRNRLEPLSPGSGAHNSSQSYVTTTRELPRKQRPRLKNLPSLGTSDVRALTGKFRKVAELMKLRGMLSVYVPETRSKRSKAWKSSRQIAVTSRWASQFLILPKEVWFQLTYCGRTEGIYCLGGIRSWNHTYGRADAFYDATLC